MWIDLKQTVANPKFTVRAGIREVPDVVGKAIFDMQKTAKAANKDFLDFVSEAQNPKLLRRVSKSSE
ncbi:MAG: hypothetical protein B6D36_05535 [Planctomycetes bacterium UTPLA1]|jgi:hypothetical protein|nr:MAG: hypothetical protein B6D36_05535 [Planctomycetes bacterium UTPLA1]